MSKTIVKLNSIEKYFGSTCVIPNLNLDIKNGEFLTLLGPNGCGKTTLLRMIAGFETPTKGKILLEDSDITHEPPFRRNVNTVFQNYALFPHLPVFDNVAYGLRQKGLNKDVIETEVEKALDMVQMKSFIHRKPKELSGGQQQRIALARAIINKPKVLLLDEPLAALDLKLRKQMQIELKNLHEQLGLTFVFVTHDQEEALTMSDRIAVIQKGVIEQLDTPEIIYNKPSTKFVADFIGDNNTLTGAIYESTFQIRDDIRVSLDKVYTNTNDALLFIRPEHVKLHAVKSDHPFSLEATVLDRIFLGHFWRIECVINGTSQKISAAVRPEETHNLQKSNTVFVSWNPSLATVAVQ